VTVVPSTPLPPCAGGAGTVVTGDVGVDVADVEVDVGSAVGVIVWPVAVGEPPAPAQPVRSRAAATETTPGRTRLASR
jgi:hypothetical protein